MEGSRKTVAVFLLFAVVVAAVQINMAAADDNGQGKSQQSFKECKNACNKSCTGVYCEMKCDTECGFQQVKAKMGKTKKD